MKFFLIFVSINNETSMRLPLAARMPFQVNHEFHFFMLFLLCSLTVTGVLATAAPSRCENPEPYKEWRLLSDEERGDYLRAVNCMRREIPSKLTAERGFFQPTNRWDDFAHVHLRINLHAHKSAQFLPWHRVFIRLMDKAMRDDCKYQGPMPYWDWSADSAAPHLSPIWTSFGTTGCIQAPILGQLDTEHPEEHCVSRTSNSLGGGGYVTPEIVGLLFKYRNYHDFRVGLEDGPHNAVHAFTGGDMREVSWSANDPIFYLHHRNVDRIWAMWQVENPNVPYLDRRGESVSIYDEMYFYGLIPNTKVIVQDGMSTTSNALNGLMCFKYENSVTYGFTKNSLQKRNFMPQNIVRFRPQNIGSFGPNNFAPVTNNRPNRIPIPSPQPLPEEFLKKMKYSNEEIKQLRQREAFFKQFIDYLNAMQAPSQAPLELLQKGLKYGWRSKTNAEVTLERITINTWIDRFLRYNQQSNKVALVA